MDVFSLVEGVIWEGRSPFYCCRVALLPTMKLLCMPVLEQQWCLDDIDVLLANSCPILVGLVSFAYHKDSHRDVLTRSNIKNKNYIWCSTYISLTYLDCNTDIQNGLLRHKALYEQHGIRLWEFCSRRGVRSPCPPVVGELFLPFMGAAPLLPVLAIIVVVSGTMWTMVL